MKPLSNIKVLMTADAVGGVWTYSAGLASALAASGAQVYLVTMGPGPRAGQREMLAASVHLIESDLALEWQDPEGNDLVYAREYLGAMERKIDPDIIHLNGYREATFDWTAPVIVVAHSCVNSWGIACGRREFLSEPRWRHYADLVAWGLDCADKWVSPTSAFGDTMRELYRPRRRPTVIHNGAFPTESALTEKDRTILAAGRMWDAAKNLSLLVGAAKDLEWPVLVAGAAAASAGSEANGIELLGELSHAELTAHMRRAAIFTSPARYEPFGLAVLEAASAGCALVLSDIPSFGELWEGAALFVRPDDAAGLRAALADLAFDSDKRARLQHAAFERAQRYSMQQMTAAYSRLYRSLLPRARMAQPKALEVSA